MSNDSISLQEFIDKYTAVQVLVKNLQTNLDVLTNLSKEEKKALMRMNLMMIRQCLMDFGA